MRNKNKAGFTLIELLVVIAIIGLLASVVLLALNGARAKARDAKRLADMRQMASAMELYFNDISGYPTQAAGTLGVTQLGWPPINPNYIGQIPTAPSPADGNCVVAGQGSNAYFWVSTQSVTLTNTYLITFCLGAATGGYSGGPHTLSPSGIQ